ncbi:unnamed protein product [Brassica oleracea]
MSDVMCFFDAAFDEAIKDGVDVLSVSIGVGGPPFRPFNVNDIEQDLEIGSFHAMTKGIPVTAGAGNSGSEAYTIAYRQKEVDLSTQNYLCSCYLRSTLITFGKGPIIFLVCVLRLEYGSCSLACFRWSFGLEKEGKIMGGGNKFEEPVKISRRRQVRKEKEEDEVNESFKSPNLEAERRRREKLHGRLMALRSHVPTVTNMTKASIVEDAITYIGELQKIVENLTEKLHEMEETPLEIYEQQTVHTIKPEVEAIDLKMEMKKTGIEENVQFCKIGKRKFWLKITTEKRPGIFTKFMEVMCLLGFEIIDITLATSNGAIIISSSVQILQGLCDGDSVDLQQTKDFLLEVMRSNP